MFRSSPAASMKSMTKSSSSIEKCSPSSANNACPTDSIKLKHASVPSDRNSKRNMDITTISDVPSSVSSKQTTSHSSDKVQLQPPPKISSSQPRITGWHPASSHSLHGSAITKTFAKKPSRKPSNATPKMHPSSSPSSQDVPTDSSPASSGFNDTSPIRTKKASTEMPWLSSKPSSAASGDMTPKASSRNNLKPGSKNSNPKKISTKHKSATGKHHFSANAHHWTANFPISRNTAKNGKPSKKTWSAPAYTRRPTNMSKISLIPPSICLTSKSCSTKPSPNSSPTTTTKNYPSEKKNDSKPSSSSTMVMKIKRSRS